MRRHHDSATEARSGSVNKPAAHKFRESEQHCGSGAKRNGGNAARLANEAKRSERFSKSKINMYLIALASLVLMFGFSLAATHTELEVFATLAITSMTICYHFTIRLVIGNITGCIKLSRFDPSTFCYRERKFERKLYKALRVKKWKKFAPTYDKSAFSVNDNTIEDIARATCRAEITHWFCVAASLASICFTVWFNALPAFLITGILGAAADLVFIVIQRYNRPRLVRLARND